ncbi:hepatitis A virus cellular receptor 2 homolog isoform X2 [Ornithorhynchus anatinus]|uniref:hepatitis A virus cellular receptor 2 homolog isoform X2 n=1 Tax=Ornithorhynchus anatinus TaxID=9258 RepID=UPI0007AA713B|nr:hepatitis A virus cellular receptor 2 homolog isoform X2 [Ornithorhynchus anatinus]
MSLHFFLSWTLMLIITDPSVSKKIVYSVGDNAILPCSYLVQNSDDLTSVCWGRGECSLTGCGDTIVTTDGKKMTFSRSDRYNLKGNLFRGHVSLTITGVTKADSGMYCCRVEIAGWFNDEKNNLELEIWPARPRPVLTTAKSTTSILRTNAPMEEHNSARPRPVLTTTKGTTSILRTNAPTEEHNSVTFTRNYTSSRHQNQTQTKMTKEPHDMNTRATAVYIGFSALVGLSLFLILAVIIFKRNLQNGGKLQNLSAISKFNPQHPRTQLAMEERPYTEENIYSIEENAYEIEDG